MFGRELQAKRLFGNIEEHERKILNEALRIQDEGNRSA
jgi:hypothetical protein